MCIVCVFKCCVCICMHFSCIYIKTSSLVRTCVASIIYHTRHMQHLRLAAQAGCLLPVYFSVLIGVQTMEWHCTDCTLLPASLDFCEGEMGWCVQHTRKAHRKSQQMLAVTILIDSLAWCSDLISLCLLKNWPHFLVQKALPHPCVLALSPWGTHPPPGLSLEFSDRYLSRPIPCHLLPRGLPDSFG